MVGAYVGKGFAVVGGVTAGILILTIQLAMPVEYLLVSFLIPLLLCPLLHYCKPEKDPKSTGTSRYMGPFAALHMNTFLLSSIIINVIWAYRWYATHCSRISALFPCSS